MQMLKRKFPRQNTQQDGFGLLEVMIALAVITPIALMGARTYMQYQDRQLAATAATQQMSIAEAARNYLTDNYADVNAALSSSAAEYLDQLIADGYLDQAQFGGGGEVNPFGQEYRVYYYQGSDNADPIETLVIARGAPSTSRGIQHTMNRHMGVASAYVGESGLESSFYDTVSYDLGRFGESGAAEGSIAYFDTLERKASASDYLYRHSVAGFPELNRMQTDLDMDGNSIVNADQVNTETLNAAQAATVGEGADTVTAQDGNLVATGDVTAEGTSYAQRFMNPNNTAFQFDPAGTAATSNVHGLTVGVNRGDRLVAGGYLRLASHGDSAGGSCPQQGLVTVDNSGMLLSCQSGRWLSPAPGSPSGTYAFFDSTSCPDGWAPANGSNGTVDLRGQFIRSWDNGRGIDSGRAIGSTQGDAIRNIKGHIDIRRTQSGNETAKADNRLFVMTAYSMSTSDRLSHSASNGQGGARYMMDASRVVPTANENRPRNVALLACMKS